MSKGKKKIKDLLIDIISDFIFSTNTLMYLYWKNPKGVVVHYFSLPLVKGYLTVLFYLFWLIKLFCFLNYIDICICFCLYRHVNRHRRDLHILHIHAHLFKCTFMSTCFIHKLLQLWANHFR